VECASAAQSGLARERYRDGVADGTQGGATPAWEFADAWILAAIGSGTRHDELSGLLGAADHYNHAIPTEAEVSRAIGRLTASGLIQVDGTCWYPTAKGAAMVARAHGGGYTYVTSLLASMSGEPIVEGTWAVPPGALDRGYRKLTRPFAWVLPPRRKRYSTHGRH
jgi:hypothetical protein